MAALDNDLFVKRFFSTCQNQREIINPYTGDKIVVPCGCCDACYYSNSVISENKVLAQSLLSKYCYFVTLTYSNRYVPYFTYKVSSFPDDESKCEVSIRSASRGSVRGLSHTSFTASFCCGIDYWTDYVKRSNLSLSKGVLKYPWRTGHIPYLCHEDYSLFFKRFRKNLYNKLSFYEQIHTYVVGEYGPKSFRPHFHFLLFFDSSEIAQVLGSTLHKSWKFGSINWSASRGDAQSYCSAYLNSFTSLPLHLRQIKPLRPFSRFSNRFGITFFQDSYEKAKTGDFDEFLNGKSLPFDGKVRTIWPWRSVIDTYFFRPAIDGRLSVHQLHSLLGYAKNIALRPGFRRKKPFQLARELYAYFYGRLSPSQCVEHLKGDYVFRQLNIFLGIDSDPSFIVSHGFKDSFINRWYTFLRYCDLFLRGCGSSLYRPARYDDNTKIISLLNLSKNFYYERSRKSLLRSLEDSEAIHCDWSYLLWHKDEATFKRFRESGLGSLCKDKLRVEIRNRTKHREINDLNFVFTQDSYYRG